MPSRELLDASNADHWIEVASNHGRAEIKQLVQEHLAGSAGRKPEGSTATRVKTFQSRQNGPGFPVHKNPRNFGPIARRVAVCEPNSDRSPAFCA